jgi:hypothetical protein
MLGFFRFACSNGLIVGSTLNQYNIRHIGSNVDSLVSKALTDITNSNQINELLTKVDVLQKTQLNPLQVKMFETKAVKLFFPEALGYDISSFESKRPEDNEDNVFNVYNRIQERMINGGVRIVNKDNAIITTKKITAVNTIVQRNAELWNLTNDYLTIQGKAA